MLCLLQTALTALERLFDTVAPDVTFGFVPVTFGECLCYQVAQARGIPQLYLYPTKIENYLAWMTSFFGRPAHIVDGYADLPADPRRRRCRGTRASVRGAGRHRLRASRRDDPRAGEAPRGPHPGRPVDVVAAPSWSAPSPVRHQVACEAVCQRGRAGDARICVLSTPLHAEPEVALAIHGKPYINQIETARTVARSLPVGMHLVVKEHPRCLGYRPVSYYDKLLRIPNVRLADPNTESKGLIQRARLVTTVWSFVGSEAVLHHTPVIVLGTPLYGILPRSMIRHVTDLNRLHAEIVDLVRTSEHDALAVEHFVAACMRGGVPMDLHTRFIEKTGRHVGDDGTTDEEQFERFVGYTVDRVRAVAGRGAVNEADVRTSVAE